MLINDERRRRLKNKQIYCNFFLLQINKILYIGSAVKFIELVSKGVISCRFSVIKLM